MSANQIRSSEDLANLVVKAAIDKKGEDILIINVKKALEIVERFVIISANNKIQVSVIFDNIIKSLKNLKIRPLGVEGKSENDWILIDLGDVVVHVFTKETREYYSLERLFKNAPVKQIKE